MSPKTVDKDAKKKEIAAAALGVFAEHGFEATSMSQIAAAAGIGKGTIYEYFESKIELTVAAAVNWVEAMEVGIEAAVDPKQDPETRFRQLCRASIDAFLSDNKMIALFFGFVQLYLSEPEAFDRHNVMREISAPMRRAIVEILLDGVSQRRFRPEIARDADRIAINLFAYLDGIGMHFIINPRYFDLRAQVDFHVENLLRSLRIPPTSQGPTDA